MGCIRRKKYAPGLQNKTCKGLSLFLVHRGKEIASLEGRGGLKGLTLYPLDKLPGQKGLRISNEQFGQEKVLLAHRG